MSLLEDFREFLESDKFLAYVADDESNLKVNHVREELGKLDLLLNGRDYSVLSLSERESYWLKRTLVIDNLGMALIDEPKGLKPEAMEMTGKAYIELLNLSYDIEDGPRDELLRT